MTQELPQNFCKKMSKLTGTGWKAFQEAMSEEPSVSVRLNPGKPLKGLFPDEEPVPWNRNGIYLKERPKFTYDPRLHCGLYYVQDASSMIYGQAMEKISDLYDGRPLRVLDLCASPGGKTTSMIDFLPEGSVITANEFVGKRCNILRENLAKWGFPDIIVTNSDTSAFAALPETFDIVAVDAPCSGEGMMRKDVRAVSQWSESLVEKCVRLQREILADAVVTLKTGGILLYSTCTFNIEENEKNAEWLKEEMGLEPIDLHPDGLPGESSQITADYGLPEARRFMPHITRGEGLFFCAFKKVAAAGDAIVKTGKASTVQKLQKRTKDYATKLPISRSLSGLLKDYLEIRVVNGQVRATGGNTWNLYEKMQDKIRKIWPGIEIAIRKGDDYLPVSELAMSTGYNREALPYHDMEEEEALKYLRHEAITLPSSVKKGIVAVGFEGYPLGFVKNLGVRANNLYPAEWRIRNSND